MKEYHYTYKISFPTGHIYYGVRSCKCLPENDTYLGSPVTHKNYWTKYEPVKTVLASWPTREIAEEIEDELILYQWSLDKNLSLNAGVNGTKFNNYGKKHTEETKLKIKNKITTEAGRRAISKAITERNIKPFKLVNPEGEIVEGVNLTEFALANNIESGGLFKVIGDKSLHYCGWTKTIEAYSLYKEFKKLRGITLKDNYFRIRWLNNTKRKSKSFKDLDQAILFRDSLEKEGYTFVVACKNWREKLNAKEISETTQGN